MALRVGTVEKAFTSTQLVEINEFELYFTNTIIQILKGTSSSQDAFNFIQANRDFFEGAFSSMGIMMNNNATSIENMILQDDVSNWWLNLLSSVNLLPMIKNNVISKYMTEQKLQSLLIMNRNTRNQFGAGPKGGFIFWDLIKYILVTLSVTYAGLNAGVTYKYGTAISDDYTIGSLIGDAFVRNIGGLLGSLGGSYIVGAAQSVKEVFVKTEYSGIPVELAKEDELKLRPDITTNKEKILNIQEQISSMTLKQKTDLKPKNYYMDLVLTKGIVVNGIPKTITIKPFERVFPNDKEKEMNIKQATNNLATAQQRVENTVVGFFGKISNTYKKKVEATHNLALEERNLKQSFLKNRQTKKAMNDENPYLLAYLSEIQPYEVGNALERAFREDLNKFFIDISKVYTQSISDPTAVKILDEINNFGLKISNLDEVRKETTQLKPYGDALVSLITDSLKGLLYNRIISNLREQEKLLASQAASAQFGLDIFSDIRFYEEVQKYFQSEMSAEDNLIVNKYLADLTIRGLIPKDMVKTAKKLAGLIRNKQITFKKVKDVDNIEKIIKKKNVGNLIDTLNSFFYNLFLLGVPLAILLQLFDKTLAIQTTQGFTFEQALQIAGSMQRPVLTNLNPVVALEAHRDALADKLMVIKEARVRGNEITYTKDGNIIIIPSKGRTNVSPPIIATSQIGNISNTNTALVRRQGGRRRAARKTHRRNLKSKKSRKVNRR